MSANTVTTAEGPHGDRRLRNWLLFALTVSSGSVDTISFIALGKVFTAFMTGNFAFLGMSLAGHIGAPGRIAVLISMAGFAGGAYLATIIATLPQQSAKKQRDQAAEVVWPGRITDALAISLIPHLAFVVIWFAAAGRPEHVVTFALLAFWSVAMGMQTAAVRWLDIGGVFTTAATATFIYLVGSFAGHPLTGEELRRLFGVIVSLIVGATAGAYFLIYVPAYAPLLPLVLSAGVVAVAAKAFGHSPTLRHQVTRSIDE